MSGRGKGGKTKSKVATFSSIVFFIALILFNCLLNPINQALHKIVFRPRNAQNKNDLTGLIEIKFCSSASLKLLSISSPLWNPVD